MGAPSECSPRGLSLLAGDCKALGLPAAPGDHEGFGPLQERGWQGSLVLEPQATAGERWPVPCRTFAGTSLGG